MTPFSNLATHLGLNATLMLGAFFMVAPIGAAAEVHEVAAPSENPEAFPFRWEIIRHPENPVLEAVPGTWEASWFGVEWVLHRKDLGKFHMYYRGSDVGNRNVKLGLASSDDGIAFRRYEGNPIWEGNWDHFLRDVRVYQRGESEFRLYYADGDRVLNMALSEDGLRWRNYKGNPILEPTQDWEHFVMQPSIIRHDGKWMMWYSTYGGSKPRVTGMATSEDGVHWTKYTGNPMFELGERGKWDDYSAFQPSVFFQDGYFHMVYTGSSKKTHPWNYHWGYAVSKDGIRWAKSPDNPIFAPGADGTWDAGKVAGHAMVRTGPNTFNMYYSGAAAPDKTYMGVGLAQGKLVKVNGD